MREGKTDRWDNYTTERSNVFQASNIIIVVGMPPRSCLDLRGIFLVFGRRALRPPCRNSGDVRLEALLVGAICARRELDERMERHLHPGTLLLRCVEEVGIDAAENGLVRDNDDVLATLQLHDNWL